MNLLEEASLLNLFKMALFGAAHSIFAPPTTFPPKICQAYPTIMKTRHNYTSPKEDAKNI